MQLEDVQQRVSKLIINENKEQRNGRLEDLRRREPERVINGNEEQDIGD